MVLFGALIATMLIAVLLDLLARPGRLAGVEGRLAGPVPHPVRSLRQRADRSQRYLQVTRIAARHGLSSYLGRRGPRTGESRPLARNPRVARSAPGTPANRVPDRYRGYPARRRALAGAEARGQSPNCGPPARPGLVGRWEPADRPCGICGLLSMWPLDRCRAGRVIPSVGGVPELPALPIEGAMTR